MIATDARAPAVRPATRDPLLDTYGIAQQPGENVYLSAHGSGTGPQERKRIANALRRPDPTGRWDAHRAHLERRANRLDDCGRYITTYADSKGSAKVAPNNCDDPLCNRCSWHRTRKIRLRYETAAAIEKANGRRVRMLTLTQRVREGESWAETHARFMKGWRGFWRDKRTKAKIKGALRRIETTYSYKAKGWHVHAHVAYAGSFWRTEDLSSVWSDHADGSIVDVREVYRDAELFKYLMKTAKVHSGLLKEYAVQSHRRRLLDLIGTWRDIKAPEPESESEMFEIEHTILERAVADPMAARWILSQYLPSLGDVTPSGAVRWAERVLASRDHQLRELAGRELRRIEGEMRRATAKLARGKPRA
mgnify:FL=1